MMLVIKPLSSYKIPKYPQEWYHEKPAVISDKLVAGGLIATLMLGLLTSCGKEVEENRPGGSLGVVGPPPSPPKAITENEARLRIIHTFEKYGIELDADVPMSFGSDNKTINLILDGYNEELRIGYEYISGNDRDTFTEKVASDTEKLIDRLVENPSEANGPFIKVIQPSASTDSIAKATEEFIRFLRDNGIL
ncbi:hypothetical protein ACFLU4_09355 [Chloroflexota bacterium]